MDLNFVKTFSSLVPACASSSEAVEKMKQGAFVTATIKQKRNPKFHKKFFAMLRVAYEYYEPDNITLSADYRQALKDLEQWLQPMLPAVDIRNSIIIPFWKQQNRKNDSVSCNKSHEAFRRFVLIEAGFYTVQPTPAGATKTAQSISFANMSETEFNECYNACAAVCWRFVLNGKLTKQQFEDAVNQMCNF